MFPKLSAQKLGIYKLLNVFAVISRVFVRW